MDRQKIREALDSVLSARAQIIDWLDFIDKKVGFIENEMKN